MKKATLTMIAAAIVAVMYFACSKHESNEALMQQDQKLTMSDEGLAVMNKIISFREKVNYQRENPHFKSGEMISAGDAVWNLEILFNATYGFPELQYGRTKSDTTVLYLAASNGEVLLDDAIALYEQIIALVTQFYINSGFDHKGFLLLSLQQGDEANGQVEILLRAVTGEREINWEYFGPEDSWWFGEEKGDCNWENDTTDAAKQIQEAIMATRALIDVMPPAGYRYIYVNDNPITRYGHEYLNQNGEYLIFYIERPDGNFTFDDKCLNPDELNFHFAGQLEVIYERIPLEYQKPSNWIFMNVEITGEETYNPANNDYPCIRHRNVLEYAYRYLVPIDVIEPPIGLD